MAYVRVSPGMYRDTTTGKIVRSATPPTTNPVTKPAATARPATPAQPAATAQTGATSDLGALQDQRKRLVNTIQARGGKQNAPNYTARLNALDEQIRGIRAQPGAVTPPAAPMNQPPPEADAAPTLAQAPAAGTEASNAVWEMLFKPTRGFDENPDYVSARNKGTEQLRNYYAGRGLLDSDSETSGMADFLSNLNAAEEKRINDYNNIASGRLSDILMSQASLGEQGRQANLGFLADMFRIGASQNPTQYGYNATSQISDLNMANAKNSVNTAAQNYQTVRGGSGGTVPSYIPPFANAPTVTTGNLLEENNNYLSGTNLLNSIASGLGSILRGL